MKETLEILANSIVLVGVGLGALFAMWRARQRRENAPRPQLTLGLESHALPPKQIVVDIAIRITNLGHVAILAGPAAIRASTCSVQTIEGATEGGLTFGRHLAMDQQYLLGTRKDPAYEHIIEPGTTEVYHVIFGTDYLGPAFIQVDFVDESALISRMDQVITLSREAGALLSTVHELNAAPRVS